jgi:hypothetical protein
MVHNKFSFWFSSPEHVKTDALGTSSVTKLRWDRRRAGRQGDASGVTPAVIMPKASTGCNTTLAMLLVLAEHQCSLAG